MLESLIISKEETNAKNGAIEIENVNIEPSSGFVILARSVKPATQVMDNRMLQGFKALSSLPSLTSFSSLLSYLAGSGCGSCQRQG